ncbi:hypothetical protein EXIGUO8H_20362 [Exiguobacterium sp. 8H]|nr:hypothetical protein EXIGUO8A_11431 [Exiguobacterium sp. 8A]VXB53310.1 hypothetical protein EXIGUO8H_20362 [Exiguobacterium sp. 8H]
MWLRLHYLRDGRPETMVFYARSNEDIHDLMEELSAEYQRYEKWSE